MLSPLWLMYSEGVIGGKRWTVDFLSLWVSFMFCTQLDTPVVPLDCHSTH